MLTPRKSLYAGALLAALLTVTPATAAPAPSGPAATFWVDPNTQAARQAATYRAQHRWKDAALIDRIARRAQAIWLNGSNPAPTVRAVTLAATRAHRTPVLVAYHIPHRDCGLHSSGGAGDAAAYRAYIDSFAAGIGPRAAYVVVEPDAVASLLAGCPGANARERHALLTYAVTRLAALPRTRVYLDAGNASWIQDVWYLASALKSAGVAKADGVALNVSNYRTNKETSAYGRRLVDVLGKVVPGSHPHFVMDTSRNGNGPWQGTDAWCNPPGRALGTPPTTRTGDALLDAYLWVKRPGESDGACRGGPGAGQWWAAKGLELARNAKG
ncbi:glycoside hydrolase family 6 protein [Streptomyces sp. VRA16 Mangrove soil]|uniref:glycoside hydrolase family 6 protein n=1 Tax=Streptomyces sp. VRA16 Mangrove soil TaxID=2817434 RepID=UPI001A9DB36A|nr:glycoside hydrolase family 6 protein [Streptomyces sp. VRA16 Mangrove soil]MBO1335386.1 glycoside hydrolase family 6 protein [Streptomyces sp. VRA16 Mangrove soil]